MVEITGFSKNDGPLTKFISLTDTGQVKSDGSACVMAHGTACRVRLDGVAALAECLGWLRPNDAIALGALRPDLPDQVEIVTKRVLDGFNGNPAPNVIARVHGSIVFKPDAPAFALIDFDMKGMSARVAARITALGGLWPALVSVVPALATAAGVWRLSTSAGLYRTDTGERFAGSGGLHVYLLVKDGTDVERFLKTLHERCWLKGLGWMMAGAGGQLLERSIVDRTVGAPEHLTFEGAPILAPPLAQDQELRRPIAREGEALDTRAAMPPLTLAEKEQVRELRAKERQRLAPDAATARAIFVTRRSRRLAERASITLAEAERIIARQCDGILLPDVMLPFDNSGLAGATVANVLADPVRFEGATLADPLEGIEYGTCKAKIMLAADGTPWIHSFAHGRTIYRFRFDFRAAASALGGAEKSEAAETLVRLVLGGDLRADEVDQLRDIAADRTGIGKGVLKTRLRDALRAQAATEAETERERRTASRLDPRPRLAAPPEDSPRVPVMVAIDTAFLDQGGLEPPMRDAENRPTDAYRRAPVGLHEMLETTANPEEEPDGASVKPTRLPAPPMLLLTPHDEYSMAHLIERYIEVYDTNKEGNERPAALNPIFVRNYMKWRDSKLPVCTAIVTSPLVLPDGTLLAMQGLDRERGILFRLQPELLALLPRPEDCTPEAAAEALRFLTDDWFCDVATDYAGKCILIATALTILERAVLEERLALFVTAGQRGSGKTTVLQMLLLAATGHPAAAAAWSPNEEERRKALFSYLSEGVPAVVWDNIPRGLTVSCPSIEKSLTSMKSSDRVLGVTGIRTVPATTVPLFTGNNIGPRGDLASRSLTVRLEIDRPDPEHRAFRHADPIAWTIEHRGNIVAALYTILLGNPRLRDRNPPPADTQFKHWWGLVGSAVEHAARPRWETLKAKADAEGRDPPRPVRFRDLFLEEEADEEQSSGLATVLGMLADHFLASTMFRAKDVANMPFAGGPEFKAALEEASGRVITAITPRTLNWRLKALADAHVRVGDWVVTLKTKPHKERDAIFWVNARYEK